MQADDGRATAGKFIEQYAADAAVPNAKEATLRSVAIKQKDRGRASASDYIENAGPPPSKKE